MMSRGRGRDGLQRQQVRRAAADASEFSHFERGQGQGQRVCINVVGGACRNERREGEHEGLAAGIREEVQRSREAEQLPFRLRTGGFVRRCGCANSAADMGGSLGSA
eukprot:764635-Hanusia_phi.AAC.4